MSLSKRNKRGIIILFVVMLLVAIIPRLYTSYFASDELDLELIEEIQTYDFPIKKQSYQSSKGSKKLRFRKPPKAFDPNQYGINDWQKLGLSKRQAEVVVKFCERGVYDVSDIQKIFVIPTELHALIQDSMLFPTKPDRLVKDFQPRTISVVEINTADTSELKELPGIGDYFASKIIEYRNRLGGFYHKEQLLEVYRMKSEIYDKILPYVHIDTLRIRKINLNTADYNTLKAHPYIDHQVANSIVKMRQQRGTFSKIGELKQSKVITDSLFLKIKPYVER